MASPRSKSKKTETQEQTPETALASTVSLADVIAATQAGQFVYTSPEFHDPLIAEGKVEINPAMVDNDGKIATRAILAEETDKPKEDTPVTQPTTKPVFAIKTASELPTRTRKPGGNREGRPSVYPFDALEINQYFFVPDSATKSGDAGKSLASTVAAANVRYAKPVEGQTRTNRKGNVVPVTVQERKFTVFGNTEEDGVKGAKVFRVAVA